jgi:high-affinity iron transporter
METIGIARDISHPSFPFRIVVSSRSAAIAPSRPTASRRSLVGWGFAGLAAAAIVAILVWQGITAAGAPDPTAAHGTAAATLDIAVLVFREGLECVLVLAAMTASLQSADAGHRTPIVYGVIAGVIATAITWFAAVRAIDALGDSLSALQLQAVTGLMAIVVLLVVMNWFFHRVYWTGWIGLHTRRKRALMDRSAAGGLPRRALIFGLAALGFTSFYREGFEVVLFLQTYRLRLGSAVVLNGAALGVAFSGIVALLTFALRRKLPYKRMLVITGLMLSVVLLVMVGEQAQEMQAAHWLSTTPIHSLEPVIRPWTGTWFSLFPNVEALAAQAVAALLVFGSYGLARARVRRAE